MQRFIPLLCVLLCVVSGTSFGQLDTIRITFVEAERQFTNGNLQMLAARFNIDAARAAIADARLWTNPNIAVEQNIYNQSTQRWFDVTSSGNTGVQIQQLFLLAGKRGKQEHIAEVNTALAEDSFNDLLRTLKLELRTDFYTIYFLHQSVEFYDESISSIEKTVSMMEGLYAQRSVLLSDVLRLKSLLFSLQNERLGLVQRIADSETSLRILLCDTSLAVKTYLPVIDLNRLEAFSPDSLSPNEVMAAALEHRPDLRKASGTVMLEEANLAYQKSLVIPDLTVGGLWSRAGSYIPNYFALTLSIDLPIFNRNQGRIELSERTLDANRLISDNYRITVSQEAVTALHRASELDHLYRASNSSFLHDYHTLLNDMIANYQKRNMSVIAFADFIESYRTSMVQMNQLANDRASAFEALSYVVGTDIFIP